MIIPVYARYNYCVYKACKFLEENNIYRYPVNPFAIIERKKWGIIKYSEIAKIHNCTLDDVITSLGSKDGFTIYDGENYTIAYNDSRRIGKRIIFTLFHEIGHIYLEHLIDFERTQLYRGSLLKEECKVLENETNAFARNVLVPASILYYFKNKSAINVSKYFGITIPASKARLDFLQSDLHCITTEGIEDRMTNIFIKYRDKRICKICGQAILINGAKFCPICGSKYIKWGDGKMIFKEFEVYEKTNKVKICPVCSNENTNIPGGYCQICGKPLINRCDDRNWDPDSAEEKPCGEIVPSNARYCPFCGHTTTFFNDGVIDDWKSEKNRQKAESDGNDDYFINITSTDDDEELPFN